MSVPEMRVLHDSVRAVAGSAAPERAADRHLALVAANARAARARGRATSGERVLRPYARFEREGRHLFQPREPAVKLFRVY